MVAEPPGLHWRCVVCGQLRSGEDIQVHSVTTTISGGASYSVTQPYCAERASCYAKAKSRAQHAMEVLQWELK